MFHSFKIFKHKCTNFSVQGEQYSLFIYLFTSINYKSLKTTYEV